MNILMIGGTAFIGPVVANHLEKQGHHITLFHRTKSHRPRFAEIQGDCRSSEALKAAIETLDPDLIIHMVAMDQSHMEALEKALACRKMKLLLISSADVYRGFEVFNRLSDAPIEAIPFTEQSALRDIPFPYRGKPGMDMWHDYDKILVEQAALQSPVLDTTVVRLGMVYGEGDPNRRFKEAIQAMHRGGKTISLHEKIAQLQMCKCYVGNVAHGVVLAAQKGAVGEIYNLADQRVLSELEWHRRIADLMKWEGELVVTSDDQDFELGKAVNLEQQLVLDSSKIRKELGFTEIVPLETALLNTIRWELANE
ncbi:NAD-dependent epimerase/dehydratase family protein [Paenibacillaceae bacterium WGS1546]|uniref:NAD-dependent epimerase/dehydratase family protein n=1 Tax=Cohnella sp. WGS1546 TaxID=3366810 RepID=UPI00372D394D